MRESHLTEYASPQAIVRQFLEEYREWITAKLGCRMEEAILLELDFSLIEAATAWVLSGTPLAPEDSAVLREVQKRIQSLELPPDTCPALTVRLTPSRQGLLTRRKKVLEARWEDGPVALWLQDFPKPIIVVSIPIVCANHAIEETCDAVIVDRHYASQFLKLIKQISQKRASSLLHVYGNGHRKVHRSKWEDLVLSDSVTHRVRRDFETFLANEAWFRSRCLPYRRGYLFHGPPGNGKTSVIRAMLHTGRLDGYSIPLFCEKTDDLYLERMFQLAASHAPSLVVLEDIDRAFPMTSTEPRASKVSVSQLLDSLDGLGTQEGLVVVATANYPSALDPAILRRPGRFDQVVEFPLPDYELRERYFRRCVPCLTPEEIELVVDQTESFSFAQLREVYILAGQRAYERDGEMAAFDLEEATRTLRSGMDPIPRQKHGVGFAAVGAASATPNLLNRAEYEGEP